MKKFITSLCVLFGLVGTTLAQTISVANVDAMPGQTVNATLVVSCPADKYTGLVFTMEFPKTGFKTAKEDIAYWEGANIVNGSMNEGKVKLAGAKANAFASAVISVAFTVEEGTELKDYNVTISGIEFQGKAGNTTIDDISFKVNVADYITLRETDTNAPGAAANVKVLMKRNFASGTWSTICLPFAMTESQAKAAFGDNVVIGDFAGYTTTETGIAVQFNQKSAIEANHPYVIKPSKVVNDGFFVEGVTIDAAEEEDLVVAAVKRTKKAWSEMIGTFSAETELTENTLFLNGGKFWYTKGNKKMLAYRAYFDFYDVLEEVESASRITITFDDVTAIKTVNTSNDEDIYTLSGQRVKNAGKGVYIVNGKKVIKK